MKMKGRFKLISCLDFLSTNIKARKSRYQANWILCLREEVSTNLILKGAECQNISVGSVEKGIIHVFNCLDHEK